MRLFVHVRPGSSRTSVGGQHDGVLVVRVQQRAIDGAATTAVEQAVAHAFGLSPHHVTCVKGRVSRRKVLKIDGDSDVLRGRLDELRNETLFP